MSDRVKISTVNGVTIKVTMFEYRYEVEILIPEEAIKKEMHIRNKNFIFHFSMKKHCYGEIKIILKRNYVRDEQGLVNIYNHSKLKFNENNYSGTITLSPKFYIPGKIIRYVKLEREKREEFAKLFKKSGVNNKHQPKPTSSIYTNYKHNNANKPYNGGKMSPK